MRASLVFLALLAVTGTARAEADVPVVQLYTMGVGDAMFERFGHAAMCLHHPDRRSADRCYNYGTTDFQTPVPLTWSFLRGEADFWVATAPPESMLELYRVSDRTVWRQDLPLEDDEAAAIATKLRHDERPENRHFTYHHFYDNCTTRLRDIIDEATAGRLREGSDERTGATYRQLVRRGFSKETVIVVGSDVVLGRALDRAPTTWEAMFLPAYLREEVQTKLGAEPVVVYERQGPELSADPGTWNRLWYVALAVLLSLPMIPVFLGRRGRGRRAGVIASAALLTLLGLFVWTSTLVSTLAELRRNEALLVFSPTDLMLLFLSEPRAQRYAQVRLALLALVAMLIGLGSFRQPLLAPMLIPAIPMAILAFVKLGDTKCE